jgi:hypothetical protein
VELWRSAPELLFFTVMVCAVEMGEILGTAAKEPEQMRRARGALPTMFCILLIGGLISAVCYGVYVAGEFGDVGRMSSACAGAATASSSGGQALSASCKEWIVFQGNLLRFSGWMALFFGAAATITETFRTWRRR